MDSLILCKKVFDLSHLKLKKLYLNKKKEFDYHKKVLLKSTIKLTFVLLDVLIEERKKRQLERQKKIENEKNQKQKKLD